MIHKHIYIPTSLKWNSFKFHFTCKGCIISQAFIYASLLCVGCILDSHGTIKCCKYLFFARRFQQFSQTMSSMIPLTMLSLDTDETVRNLSIEFSVALLRLTYSCSCSFSVNPHFQRTTCSQIYFRFSSYLLRKPHLFVILTRLDDLS
jgi:hypothetical protein